MINGTLVVQVFNFLIGYLFLRYILLEPGLVLMQKRAEKERKLSQEIALLCDSIASQEADQQLSWKRFCKKLSGQRPCVKPVTILDKRKVSLEQDLLIDARQENKLIGSMKKIIIKQVIQG